MKPIAVFYATREGQTGRIAERIAEDLRQRAFVVELRNVRDGCAIHPDDYSGVVLAASVHAGTHEAEMVRFVRTYRDELDRMPTAFLSVTLSEAGAEMEENSPEARAAFVSDAERMIEKFVADTGWHPKKVKAVAGALLYSRYNPVVKFVMKRIARKAGLPPRPLGTIYTSTGNRWTVLPGNWRMRFPDPPPTSTDDMRLSHSHDLISNDAIIRADEQPGIEPAESVALLKGICGRRPAPHRELTATP